MWLFLVGQKFDIFCISNNTYKQIMVTVSIETLGMRPMNCTYLIQQVVKLCL
jgi:hypothetical protein